MYKQKLYAIKNTHGILYYTVSPTEERSIRKFASGLEIDPEEFKKQGYSIVPVTLTEVKETDDAI
jgi:hypothetical protein